MFYTKAIIDMLRELGEPYITYFSYYIDNYFNTLEDPKLKDEDLRRAWYMILISGLHYEIAHSGKYKSLAKAQLTKLLNYNAKWYENKASTKTIEVVVDVDKNGNDITELQEVPMPEYKLKTITEAESKIQVKGKTKNCIVVYDTRDKTEYKMPMQWLLHWANRHGRWWEDLGLKISYVFYEAFNDFLEQKKREERETRDKEEGMILESI